MISTNTEVSKDELLYVYRKVKRDLYFEKDHIFLDKIVKFEEKLEKNIDAIYKLLKSNSIENIISSIDVGECTFFYKNIQFEENKEDKIIASRTIENYQQNLFKIKKVEGRYVGDISLLFQIIGGIWINRIGYQIDTMLSDNVYGCRLEKYNSKSGFEYYKQNHTLFKSYFTDFKTWQNNLFKKIEQAEKKDILVITFDLTKYYHSVDIDLLEEKIEEIIKELDVTEFDIILNQILFGLIRKFNSKNNYYYISFYELDENMQIESNKGLPLTLNVSKVLANIYLKSFDDDIENNVKPLYYGRYVDDYIIAVEHNSKSNLDLNNILNGLKYHNINSDNEINYHSKQNEIKIIGKFNKEKEKIFLFNYEKDKTEINHLKKSVNKNSSEWKLIPDTSEYDEINTSEFFNDVNKDCEEIDSLRKSTGLTIKRNQFVREIIGFENNINFLQQDYWINRLNKFLDLIYDYVFDFKNFVDLSKYIPRLFGLIIHSSSKEIKYKYFERLEEIFKIFILINQNQTRWVTFANDFLRKKIFETIITTLPLNFDERHSETSTLLRKYLSQYYYKHQNKTKIYITQYFNSDLHRIPYKDCYFKYDEYVIFLNRNIRGIEKSIVNFFSFEEIHFVTKNLHSIQCGSEDQKCNLECKKITESSGFFFYTRRITLLELSIAFKNKIITSYSEFSQLAKSYYHIVQLDTKKSENNFNDNYTFVDFDLKNSNIKSLSNPIIATTHFLTNYSSYDANVRDILDTDLQRLDRLIKIVNDVIKSCRKIDYLVFHELSLPRNLYVQLATKLAIVDINLIAGIDYKINRNKKEADNQLVYILKNLAGSTNQSIALYQSKMIGAVHEKQDIMEKANLKITPNFKEKLIIRHKGFVFSGLICNDLLYIENRASLVGKIDNLFVIAWNQDIETYENLVKSSCLDIHSFITLCNNREYGDTRIRAPYKDSWKRDIMKIHGGMLDNFILAELDIKALRDFQTNEIPPKKPFKPFPIGFKISKERRLL